MNQKQNAHMRRELGIEPRPSGAYCRERIAMPPASPMNLMADEAIIQGSIEF